MITALSKLTKNFLNSFGRNNSFKPASFKANDEFIFGEENIIEFNKVEQSKKQNMTSDKVKFFIIVKLKSILPTTYLKKALDTISDERLLKIIDVVSTENLKKIIDSMSDKKLTEVIDFILEGKIEKIIEVPLQRLVDVINTTSCKNLEKIITTISNHDLPQVMQNISIEKNIQILNLFHNTSYIEDSMPLIETLGIYDAYCSKAILV